MDPTTIIMIVALVAIFYFFMIRPQSKEKKKAKEMMESMSVGDSIETIGGILGKIVSIDEDKLIFETSEDRVRLQLKKAAVKTVTKAKSAD